MTGEAGLGCSKSPDEPAIAVRSTRSMRLLIVLALVLASAVAAAADEPRTKAVRRSQAEESTTESKKPSGDLYALVVGVSTYRSSKIPKLDFAARDAQEFGEFLKRQKQLFNKIHVDVLTDEKAVKRELEKVLFYDMLKAGKDDSVIIYLSGYGAIDPRRGTDFFFLTHDADPGFLAVTSVLMNRARLLKKLSARQTLVIADISQSADFLDSRTKSMAPAMQTVLEQFRNSSGEVIITSGRPNELSRMMPEGSNSVFGHYLMKGLRGDADLDHDGFVTVTEAYDYVYRQTRTATEGRQNPMLQGHVAGYFPLALLRSAAGPFIEIQTKPVGARIFVRDESQFNFVDKTDEEGRLLLEDVPKNKPMFVMARKKGWKDKILGPVVLSDAQPNVTLAPVVLEPSTAFLVVATNVKEAIVKLGEEIVAKTGDNNVVIIDKIQVGVPHEITISKEGHEEKRLKVTIPVHLEGKVYRSPYILLRKAEAEREQTEPSAEGKKARIEPAPAPPAKEERRPAPRPEPRRAAPKPRRSYTADLATLKRMAENGDPRAQCKVGDIYYFGRGGGEKDLSEAAMWYGMAVDQDYTCAHQK